MNRTAKPAASKPRAVGTGLVALDVLIENPKQTPKTYAGGSCGNVMAILAWSGWTATPWSRLGNDANAKHVRKDLEHFGVNVNHLEQAAGGGTPVIVQENRRTATGQLTHKFHWKCPSCGNPYPRFRATLLNAVAGVAKSTGHPAVYFFDRATPAAIKLAETYRATGTTVIFEPNSIRDEKLFQRAVQQAHVLKYSAERLDAFQDLLEAVQVPLQIETLGADGLQFRLRRSAWAKLPSFKAPVFIDAAGSGDWCTAALIDQAFRKKVDWKTAKAEVIRHGLERGQAFAALNCGYPGARGMMYHINAETAQRQVAELVAKRAVTPAPLSTPSWPTWTVCNLCEETPPTADRAKKSRSRKPQ